MSGTAGAGAASDSRAMLRVKPDPAAAAKTQRRPRQLWGPVIRSRIYPGRPVEQFDVVVTGQGPAARLLLAGSH